MGNQVIHQNLFDHFCPLYVTFFFPNILKWSHLVAKISLTVTREDFIKCSHTRKPQDPEMF